MLKCERISGKYGSLTGSAMVISWHTVGWLLAEDYGAWLNCVGTKFRY
jgi:hypothetical protein